MWFIDEVEPAWDGTRIPPEQDTELVFSLLDGLLQGNNLCFRLLDKQLCLIHIGDRVLAALVINGIDAQAVLIRSDRLLGKIKLRIQLAQLKVNQRGGRDQRRLNQMPRVFRGQKIGASGLGRSAILSPEIDEVTHLQTGSVKRRRTPSAGRLLILHSKRS